MTVTDELRRRFPTTMDEARYVAVAGDALRRAGFTADNTLMAVSVCRDELARSLVSRLEGEWGSVFDLSGLAGLPSGGATAVSAALGHLPTSEGRSNFVLFGLSHVGLDSDGTVGRVLRPGTDHCGPTCGSLAAASEALAEGAARSRRDDYDHDYEQTRVEQRMAARLGEGPVPDLAEMADHALACIELDFQVILDRVAGPSRAGSRVGGPLGFDGAVFTGMQIHMHPERTAVRPGRATIEVDGEAVGDDVFDQMLRE